jgi:hypothetical protein
MFTTHISPTPIAVRHAELIAAADAARLARRVRLARRPEQCSAAAPRARRSWLRTVTQPAQI